MNSKEKYLQTLQKNPVNSIPVTPIVVQYAASFSGYTIREYTKNPKIMAKALVNTQQALNYDAIYVSADTWVNASAMGSEITYPEENPAEGQTLLESKSDINALREPDPSKDGRWPKMLKAAELVVENNQSNACVIGNIDQSPFSLAAELRGIKSFMKDLKQDPKFATDLLEICSKTVMTYGKAMAKKGVDVLNTGDSIAQTIGPDHYREFALPYEKKVFRELKEVTGLPITLHICGDTTKLLDHVPESGADGFEVDHAVDLGKAFEKIGDKMCVIGNVDPIEVLLNKSPEEIKTRVKSILNKYGEKDGFVLASGCGIAPENPTENIEAMINATNNYFRD